MAEVMNRRWKVAKIQDIPPIKDSWSEGWHSVRHHLGISAFGINAATKSKGESLTPVHDELEDGQEEVFVVLEGAAEFTLDGKKLLLQKGMILSVDPEVKRGAVALKSPTTLLIIGAPVGKAYSPPAWETG
jgi:uncharacterized cupin superfamily protein